jgi:hypothetical protein
MLALMLVDLRATTEAMRRSVTNAQASLEHYAIREVATD